MPSWVFWLEGCFCCFRQKKVFSDFAFIQTSHLMHETLLSRIISFLSKTVLKLGYEKQWLALFSKLITPLTLSLLEVAKIKIQENSQLSVFQILPNN